MKVDYCKIKRVRVRHNSTMDLSGLVVYFCLLQLFRDSSIHFFCPFHSLIDNDSNDHDNDNDSSVTSYDFCGLTRLIVDNGHDLLWLLRLWQRHDLMFDNQEWHWTAFQFLLNFCLFGQCLRPSPRCPSHRCPSPRRRGSVRKCSHCLGPRCRIQSLVFVALIRLLLNPRFCP